jgi:hypothetical protein
MEKIMSKSNDSSFTVDLGGDATCTGRLLRDDELQQVSGGYVYDSTYAMGIVAAQTKTACTRMANADYC